MAQTMKSKMRSRNGFGTGTRDGSLHRPVMQLDDGADLDFLVGPDGAPIPRQSR